jgi:hypothetical protein
MVRRQRRVEHVLCVTLILCLVMACGTFDMGIAPQATVAAKFTVTPSPTAAGQPLPTALPTAAGPKATPVPPAVTTLAVTPDGAVWYGYGRLASPTDGGGGVKRFVDGETTSFGLADGLPHEHVQLLEVAPDGALWAAAERHLARFGGQTWDTIDCVGEYARNIILDLAFAADGSVWAASPFALVRFDGQSCTTYDRLIRAVAVASDGTLWASG